MTAARVRGWLLRTWVTLVFAYLLLPVVVVALASFSRTSYLTVPPKGLTLRWFSAVLGDPDYIHAIVFSLGLALVATVGSFAVAVAATTMVGQSLGIGWSIGDGAAADEGNGRLAQVIAGNALYTVWHLGGIVDLRPNPRRTLHPSAGTNGNAGIVGERHVSASPTGLAAGSPAPAP